MGAGVVQSYYLTAGTMVVGQNGEYAIDNNGAQISLRDFIWRTGEDHYLIAGEGMEMIMPDGSSVTPDGYVEVTYLEDGVVQMIADEQVWTTVAAGAEIDWNGTQLKLDERTIEDENGTRTIVLDEWYMYREPQPSGVRNILPGTLRWKTDRMVRTEKPEKMEKTV